jgi:ubiquinone/menaquinone biosynthesis C-methylase UbiE
MDHTDHLDLIRKGIPNQGGVWAEFGSGRGAFTLALAELVGMEGEIYSVDRDRWALETQKTTIKKRFKGRKPRMHYIVADFTNDLDLPPLNGLLMANSLHFQRDKEPILRGILDYLSPGGCLILVEYNIHRGNPWVPYPIPYYDWEVMAKECGFINTRILGTRPSSSMREIYSAASEKPI